MNMKHSSLWHFGFFFWIFGFGIFSLPSLADLEEEMMGKTAFEYLLQKNASFSEESTALLSSMRVTKMLSLSSEPEHPSQYLHRQNRNFLIEKKQNTPVPVFSEDIKLQRDVDFFVTLDIWQYLLTFEDREKGLNQYISWAKTLLLAMDHNTTQKDAQLKELKALISVQKELLSENTDLYSQAVGAGDSVSMEQYKAKKASHAYEISLLESQWEEISKRTKSLSAYKKTIEQLLLGAEENKDALLKNVKVKSPSGEYIKAIEK